MSSDTTIEKWVPPYADVEDWVERFRINSGVDLREEEINRVALVMHEDDSWNRAEPSLGLRVFRRIKSQDEGLAEGIFYMILGHAKHAEWDVDPIEWMKILEDQFNSGNCTEKELSNFLKLLSSEVKHHPTFFQELKRAGWDVNTIYGNDDTSYRGNLLEIASHCYEGIEILSPLLQEGAEASPEECLSHILPHVTWETISVVTSFLEKGVDIHWCDASTGETLLHKASRNVYTEVPVRLLLQKGANVNTLSLNGMTPLHCVAAGGIATTVSELIKAGAEKSVLDLQGNNEIDHAVAARIKNGSAKSSMNLSRLLEKEFLDEDVLFKVAKQESIIALIPEVPTARFVAPNVQRWTEYITTVIPEDKNPLCIAAKTWVMMTACDDAQVKRQVKDLLHLNGISGPLKRDIVNQILLCQPLCREKLYAFYPSEGARLAVFLRGLLLKNEREKVRVILGSLSKEEPALDDLFGCQEFTEELALEFITIHPEICLERIQPFVESSDWGADVVGPLASLHVMAALGDERILSLDLEPVDLFPLQSTVLGVIDLAYRSGQKRIAMELFEKHSAPSESELASRSANDSVIKRCKKALLAGAPHLGLAIYAEEVKETIPSDSLSVRYTFQEMRLLQDALDHHNDPSSILILARNLIEALNFDEKNDKLSRVTLLYITHVLGSEYPELLALLEDNIGSYLFGSSDFSYSREHFAPVKRYLHLCSGSLQGEGMMSRCTIPLTMKGSQISDEVQIQLRCLLYNSFKYCSPFGFADFRNRKQLLHNLVQLEWWQAATCVVQSEWGAEMLFSRDRQQRLPIHCVGDKSQEAEEFVWASLQKMPKETWVEQLSSCHRYSSTLRSGPITLLDNAVIMGWNKVFSLLLESDLGTIEFWQSYSGNWNIIHSFAWADAVDLFDQFSARMMLDLSIAEPVMWRMVTTHHPEEDQPIHVAAGYFKVSMTKNLLKFMAIRPEVLMESLRIEVETGYNLYNWLIQYPIFDEAVMPVVYNIWQEGYPSAGRTVEDLVKGGFPKTVMQLFEYGKAPIHEGALSALFQRYPKDALQKSYLVVELRRISPDKFVALVMDAHTPSYMISVATDAQKEALPVNLRNLGSFIPNPDFLAEQEDAQLPLLDTVTFEQLVEMYSEFNFEDSESPKYVNFEEVRAYGFESTPDIVASKLLRLKKDLEEANLKQAISFSGTQTELQENYEKCLKLLLHITDRIQKLPKPEQQALWIAQVAEAAEFCHTGIVSRLYTIFGALNGQVIVENEAYEETVRRHMRSFVIDAVQKMASMYQSTEIPIDGIDSHLYNYFLALILEQIKLPMSDLVENKDRYVSEDVRAQFPPEYVSVIFMADFFGTTDIVEHIASIINNNSLSGSSIVGSTREVAYQTPPAWMRPPVQYPDLYEMDGEGEVLGIKPDVVAHALSLTHCLSVYPTPPVSERKREGEALEAEGRVQKRVRY